MLKFDALPQLAIGTHEQGSGRACIMNAISYLNGDKTITDTPGCVWTPLAQMAQSVNDAICQPRHWEKLGRSVTISNGRPELLCPSCTHQMWMFGAELIGSAEAYGNWWTREKTTRAKAGPFPLVAIRIEVAYRLAGALLRGMRPLNDGWPVPAELVERCMTMPELKEDPGACHGMFLVDQDLLNQVQELRVDSFIASSPAPAHITFITGLYFLVQLPGASDGVFGMMNNVFVQLLGSLSPEQLIPAALAIVDEFMAMTKHVPIYPTYDEIDAMADKVGLTAVAV